ncbi:hypothetical protein F4781DRAFT_428879 [Annulohypoxylon bovei var. microspora]|nr:hypothetical protein F4781DRAFT_428879 [Annulohypoxylon bovei var. microspora]
MEMQRPPKSGRPGWPSNYVPVEIFWEIARDLPDRKDLGAMRLVSREFNMKIVCVFMKQMVISFGPEQSMKFGYGTGLCSNVSSIDITESLLDSSAFKYLGTDIRRLGLALEVTESDLASPVVDELEEINIRDWGLYRWPVPQSGVYQSQTSLEKVTESLEKCQGVFRLMSKATDVRELALSCDGGLGHLSGPDVNGYQPPGRLSVFSNHNGARKTKDTQALEVRFDTPYQAEVLKRKMIAAGVKPTDVAGMIEKLAAYEGTTREELLREERKRAPLPESRYTHPVTRPSVVNDAIRLQPDQLTDSQKWLIFKHLSAQQAMIQSFLVATLHNSAKFERLTKLNIARIPSFHLHNLRRHEFWSSLPQVQEVALGVIPDWRCVKQKNPYETEVRQVYPTDAMPLVLDLLENYIGTQPHIKRLHFEWHCGGEFAPGIMQRGKYVLPAPFLRKHQMVIDSSDENLMYLPFITHLSLKNCWFAPNVFYRLMDGMAREYSLESLELETVSLSGPPILREHMVDRDLEVPEIQIGDENGVPGYLLRAPYPLSWSSVIDMLSPVKTISEHLAERLGTYPPYRVSKEGKIRKLVFKSCGYVDVVDWRFISDRRFEHLKLTSALSRRKNQFEGWFSPKRTELGQFLQISTDRHLAKVRDRFDPVEMTVMQQIWGFKQGWKGVYEDVVINAALFDGMFFPGLGRFSGTIERDPNSPRVNPDEETVEYSFDTSDFEQGYNDIAGLDLLMSGIETGYTVNLHDFQAVPGG